MEPWELGAPSSVGPAAAVSGSNTWGTDLDAPYAFAQIFGATTATHLQRFVDFTAIVPPFSPAPLSVVLTEWEWLDVHRDEAGCPPPGGLVSLSACGVGGCPTPPDRGFDATYCTWSDGNTGSSGGWIPVAYDLTPWVPGGFVDIAWSLVRGSGSTTGAGWYLDDISVDITLAWVPGTFGP